MMNTKALFLGSYGENQDIFQKWVNFLIEDVVQWQRNFHPNDPNLVSRKEKNNTDYIDTLSNVEESLDQILSELKQSLPYHSPRYLGHMLSVLSMPAVLGYFAGILYNQNNVVGEVSPITTRLELEFMSKICEMIGYAPFSMKFDKDKPASFGHLSSGGSTAILEGLWTARNIKYYPLSLRLFINSEKVNKKHESENLEDAENLESKRFYFGDLNKIEIKLPNGTIKEFSKVTSIELLNISPDEVLNLIERINEKLETAERIKEYQELIEPFLVQSKGIAGIHAEFKEKLPLPKLFVSQTSHYSWKKNMDILGFGKESVVNIKSDNNFKLDTNDLKLKIYENINYPILAIIAIVGTTEEGAIDPVSDILDLKKNYIEKELNKSFYFKVDAAWGGYFSSMFKDSNEDKLLIQNIKKDIVAICNADSVVIDPHKQGFIPYAVGSISYKDTRFKDFIYKGAPYLATSNIGIDPIENTYLGGWTLEGSRSGASAVACALSTRAIPLDSSGYGKIIYQGIEMCFKFYEKLEVFNNEKHDFKIIPIYKPQTNVACYIVTSPEYIFDVKYLNLLNKKIYKKFSFHPKNPIQNYDYFISSTELKYLSYKDVIDEVIKPIIINNQDFDLTFLRSVFMNPNLKDYEISNWEDNEHKKIPIIDDFLSELISSANNTLPFILLEILKDINEGKRLKILWIENKKSFEVIKNKIEINDLEGLPSIGSYLDIDFDNFEGKDNEKNTLNRIKKNQYDFIIFDLNLTDHHHKEWKSGLNLINKVYSNIEIKSKPIIYSKFLLNKNIKNNFYKMLKEKLPEFFYHEMQLIGKEDGDDVKIESLLKMIKSIYKFSQ